MNRAIAFTTFIKVSFSVQAVFAKGGVFVAALTLVCVLVESCEFFHNGSCVHVLGLRSEKELWISEPLEPVAVRRSTRSRQSRNSRRN